MTSPICDWCGGDHPREALCASRPRWSRRGFLALFGAGLAGMALPSLPVLDAVADGPMTFGYRFVLLGEHNVDGAVTRLFVPAMLGSSYAWTPETSEQQDRCDISASPWPPPGATVQP